MTTKVVFDIKALRSLHPETKRRTHKRDFSPMITDRTLKRLRDDFAPNFVGGSASSWGALSHLTELALNLLMAVVDNRTITSHGGLIPNDAAMVGQQLASTIPSAKLRGKVADNLRIIATILEIPT